MSHSTDSYRKKIGEFVWFAINHSGRTMPQIMQNCRIITGDDVQLPHGNAPIWHTRSSLIDYVARQMKIDPRHYGPQRISSDFHNYIDQEITKLRRSKKIADWNSTAKAGIFRPTVQVHVPRPSMEWKSPELFHASGEIGSMKSAFVSIMRHGSKDNTYKFALARALLEYCRDRPYEGRETLDIQYDYFAEKFLNYYWDQECRFRMRQSHKTATVPRAIQIIRSVATDAKNDFEKLDNTGKKNARNLMLKNVFGTTRSKTSLVIPKFQKIKQGKYAVLKEIFYTFDDEKKILRLEPEAFEFFRNNHNILWGTVMVEWAKFLEKINGSLPMLIAKLENAEAKRESLKKYLDAYRPHANHCFYCCNTLEKNHTQVDHFIPWSYMFDDNAWNMVLACSDCNCKKSNSLPSGFLGDLIERNYKYRQTIEILEKSIRNIDSRLGWEKEIENHYSTCKEYGFAEISMG